MTLYDKDGRPEFLTTTEARNAIIDYQEFSIRRSAFYEDQDTHARILLNDIATMRRMGESVGLPFPDDFGLTSTDLDELEEECKKYLS